jgi:hypothetical protein
VSSENRRFSGSRESSILERLVEEGGLAPCTAEAKQVASRLIM